MLYAVFGWNQRLPHHLPSQLCVLRNLSLILLNWRRIKLPSKKKWPTPFVLNQGVLTLYSVAEKEHPNRLHFFEIYSNEAAYQSHIASPHFQKYVKTTQSMILSKELIETVPVQLSTQPGR